MIEGCQVTNPQQDIDNIVFRARIIWRDIASWTRSYLVRKTLHADIQLQELVAKKLLSVVEDFGGIIRTFFGDKVADDYTNLFSEYITLIISLIDALVEGDSSVANVIVKQIYENSGKRAEFLAGVNPYWDKNTLENYIFTFTDMTIRENGFYIKTV